MRTISARITKPDFLLTYKFFSQMGNISKLLVTDKRVKASIKEPLSIVNICLDFTRTGKNVSFDRLHRHLENYGSVSYFRLDDNIAYFRFSTLEETFKAYEDLKRYTMGTIKISFVSE